MRRPGAAALTDRWTHDPKRAGCGRIVADEGVVGEPLERAAVGAGVTEGVPGGQ
jgi:hypothetical protein